jgi:hypothetical protein
MRYVGYAWKILVGLVSLAFALALLRATHTVFETIVVAGLLVVYAGIVGSFKFQQRCPP